MDELEATFDNWQRTVIDASVEYDTIRMQHLRVDNDVHRRSATSS